MKAKIKLTCIILIIGLYSSGQIDQYSYKRELSGIKDQWHMIVLPDNIFGKVSPDFSDIRIIGLSTNNDTIEAPYILKINEDKILQKEVSFNLINQSANDKGYYFTFEVPADNSVNQISLEFKQQNFDWRAALDGSQNLREWFSIIEDYRILSIKNDLTDFQFTKVGFPESKYRYFRLLINSDEKPELISVKISLNEIVEGNYNNYIVVATKTDEDKKNKQTIVDIDLKTPVPICCLRISVKDRIDYYRPLTIKYLSDSVKTEKGWKYYYSTLTSGTLNSIEKNEFRFNSTVLKRLRITVDNQNNAPLKIDSLIVKGYVHELVGRFNEPAAYSLIYGNKRTVKPNYDIHHFTDKIPAALSSLTLGTEQLVGSKAKNKQTPFFQNKMWLWSIMALIIVILGWFSLRMIRQRQ
jgi:hypothetical protein